jgi:UDP-glucose 4-epimerase
MEVKFVCLRYFNASGATEKFGEDHRPETHLIPAVLQVALGEKPNVEIYGTDYDTPDGTCIRDLHFTSSISPRRIFWLSAKPPAAVTTSARVAVRAFEK